MAMLSGMFSLHTVKSAVETAWDEFEEDVVHAAVAHVGMCRYQTHKSGEVSP